ncbi:hypothetical protein ABEB36_007755 [Hypothenemus hampei]|uniref:Uncharacterized protein n=1 Tax=Hypothenemus hampei TaxID=57062 RepID=A0ABD1EYZ1_HYPHA
MARLFIFDEVLNDKSKFPSQYCILTAEDVFLEIRQNMFFHYNECPAHYFVNIPGLLDVTF